MTVLDQASHLRTLVRQQPRAVVYAITSGKGGVGKSNLAVNLAMQFASAGKDVVVLDADLGLANCDVLCNIDVPFNLSHVVAGRKSLRDVMVPAPGGFRLIAGASGLARMADLGDYERRQIIESLAGLEEQADIILIDTGAGISPNVLAFARAADHVLVITTPEPTAITDAYAVVKVLSRDGIDRGIGLLVNQVRSVQEGRLVYDRIARVCRQFLSVSLADAGYMSLDENVSAAVRRRMPFALAFPRCPASLCVAQLASRLEDGVAAPGRRDSSSDCSAGGEGEVKYGQPDRRMPVADRLRHLPGHWRLAGGQLVFHGGAAGAAGNGRHVRYRAGPGADGAKNAGRKLADGRGKTQKINETGESRPIKTIGFAAPLTSKVREALGPIGSFKPMDWERSYGQERHSRDQGRVD